MKIGLIFHEANFKKRNCNWHKMAKKKKQTKEKHMFWIWGSSSEIERLPSTQEALGSIPSTAKQNKTIHPIQEKAIS